MKVTFTILLLFAAMQGLHAQHDPYTSPVWRTMPKEIEKNDSTSLLAAFKKGTMQGNFRNFSMVTINEGELSDYYANALGGGIHYQTAPVKGFQLTISGYFIFNTASSNLNDKDPQTGARNRYEIGLFDIEDATNSNDINRLEELHLQYSHDHYKLIFGKQIVRTPFINPQDGRMRPTEVEGIYGQAAVTEKWNIQGGWLYKISPRSTVRWFPVGASIGVYPSGLNTDGSPSGYSQSIKSAGVGLLGITWNPTKNISIKGWEQFTENVFNTAMIQVDTEIPNENGSWIGGIQYTRQDILGNGGNPDPGKSYFPPGTRTQIFSSRIGWKEPLWQATLNYTRIGKGGRFLSPREWGREPFYTFLQRERNEGLGNVHAIMAKASRSIPKSRIKIDAGAGYYKLPDIKDHAHNKYGLPSYIQYLFDVRYDFNGWLKGLDIDFLYVYKQRTGETYGDPKSIINKVNMSNINLVFNYSF